MCGIFGIVGPAVAANRIDLGTALAALRHRGPDDSGTFESQVRTAPGCSVACRFAHTRLAILDLSPGGHQPMTSGDGRFTVVFNGEIYNFREVRRDLESQGYSFNTSSDTEVLLAAYRAHGDRCVETLRGMFAFAIWDNKLGRLFAARDRLGIKPFYYTTHSDGTIAFASEVRALLRTGVVSGAVDPRGLVSYLRFGSVFEPLTMVSGVRVLEAAHTLTWAGGAAATRQYWEIPWGQTSAVPLDELRDLVEQAVKLRLIADVPVGLFLSGGMDSTALAALASNHAPPQTVSTFTVCFEEQDYNEGHFAAEVAARFGCRHHEIHLSEEQVCEQLPAAAAALDQPSADGVNTYVVSRAVRDAGLVVALSGLGGDEVFAGYDHFRRIGILRRLAPVTRIAGAATRGFLNNTVDRLSVSWLRKLLDSAARSVGPGSTYAAIRGMYTWREIGRLLGRPEEEACLESWELQVNEDCGIRSLDVDPINQLSALELCGYLRNTLLRDSDVMSMAHALEIRVPLLDHKVVEALAAVPGARKIAPRSNKPLLRDIVPDIPRMATTRAKRGFVLPFDVWLRGPLKRWARDILHSTDRRTGLQPKAVLGVWDDFLAGRVSWSRVWTLIALLLWLDDNGLSG
jgi:asparagine synthase (glutamine-hydrolysing)